MCGAPSLDGVEIFKTILLPEWIAAILPYDQVNHNPIISIDGSTSKAVTYRSIVAGSTLFLDASGTSDPDNDEVSFHWWLYEEAGTYPGSVGY